MNVKFIKYNGEGRVLFIGEVPVDMLELQNDGINFITQGDVDPNVQYIANGVVVDRPNQATNYEGGRLVNVPVPSVIFVNDIKYEGTEDTIDFDFTYPGLYKISVIAFPYLDYYTELLKK